MKIILLTILIAILSLSLIPTRTHAISLCTNLIQRYYTCKFIDSSSSYLKNYMNNYKSNYYDMTYSKPTFTSNFYESILKPVSTSFEQAMDYFQEINRELANCTRQEVWCQCVQGDNEDILSRILRNPFYNLEYFFNNATFYPQMVKLIKALKENTTLVNSTYIDEYYSELNTFANPIVKQFCLKNDFTSRQLYLYEETHICNKVTSNVDDKDFEACIFSYLGFRAHAFYEFSLISYLFSDFNRNDLEQLSRCWIHILNYTNCNLDISRYFVMNMISKYPQIITGNNLTVYIDSLLNSSNTAPPLLYLDSVDTYMYWNAEIKSFKAESSLKCEEFDFDSNCFDSKHLKIQCRGQKSSIKVSFIDSGTNKRIDYVFNSTTALRSQENVILHSNGEKWLESFLRPKDNERIIILDYQTNSTLEINTV